MSNSNIQTQESQAGKLSWLTRLAYGCGDTACNIVMAGMVNSLLTLFYTDYAGVPIATVGLVMLLSRFFDGTSDVIMGVLVEKTHSRWGKARPWLLAVSIVRAIGQAPITAVIFGMMGDVVEYGQWKFHVRQESLIFGGGSLGFKIGSGISAAIVTSLLGAAGFVSSATGGAAQPETAKAMIIHIYQYGILGIWVAAAIVLVLYKLDKLYPRIMDDLAEREKHGEL